MFSEVAADLSFHIPAHHSHLLVSLHHRCQSPKKSQKQGGATGKVRSSKNERSPPGAGTLTQLSATDHSATVEAEERGGDFSVARLHRSNHRGSRHWRRRHTHIPRSHRQQVEWGRAGHVELHFLGSEYVSWQQFF